MSYPVLVSGKVADTPDGPYAPPAEPPPSYAPPGVDLSGKPAVAVVPPTMHFGELPVRFRCQYCEGEGVTITKRKLGLVSWLITGTVCLVLLPFGCCCFGAGALCVPQFKDTEHTCPFCNRVVGVSGLMEPVYMD
eukprot:TRINITY_DN3681_c0_g1_i4.p2 TRINITY_DN3681_c0_g1~~TRINITY_DN3681_c0_g1_i4.p2  ORF type:complete len:135 (+),score=22.46 TRINITY_DN3681_c0_g1_i4:24-428(+)